MARRAVSLITHTLSVLFLLSPDIANNEFQQIIFTAAQSKLSELTGENTRNKVLLFRHAIAPGGGDPVGFDVNDCTTQRNLDETGKDQAKNLGKAIRNIEFWSKVYSSPWCRCVGTAELMKTELEAASTTTYTVETTSMLSSFYEAPPKGADKAATMALLNAHMDAFGNKIAAAAAAAGASAMMKPELMITHYVVISALTGHAVCSGCAVLYDPVAKRGVPLENDLSAALVKADSAAAAAKEAPAVTGASSNSATSTTGKSSTAETSAGCASTVSEKSALCSTGGLTAKIGGSYYFISYFGLLFFVF